jgi:hypothetical protein
MMVFSMIFKREILREAEIPADYLSLAEEKRLELIAIVLNLCVFELTHRS